MPSPGTSESDDKRSKSCEDMTFMTGPESLDIHYS